MAPYVTLYDQALQQFLQAARRDYAKESDVKGEAQISDFLKSRESAQSARESAAELQTDASKKYSTKKIRGKEVIPEKWIGNIMGNIGNAINVGNFLMTGAPESVGMAWFVVKIGLNAVKSNYDLYSLFGSGLTTVTEIMILVPHYDELFHERRSTKASSSEMEDLLYRDIVATYAAVLDFCFAIKRHLEASRLKQLGHGFQDLFGASVTKFQAKQNAIATLKAKVLEASDGVFKGRVSGQLDDVQASLQKSLGDIRSFASVATELSESQGEMLKILQEMKTNFKPKTRWDLLKQEFEKIKRTLDPLHEDPADLRRLLDKRTPSTPSWLSGSKAFMSWRSATAGSLLCLSSPAGAGKSVTVASLMDELDSMATNETPVLCYCSCATGNGVGLGSEPLTKVRSSITFQLYRLAAEDESKANLLEECNKLFQSSKKTQSSLTGQQGGTSKRIEADLPEFCDTILRLSTALHRNVIIIVDAVDELPGSDQGLLYEDFQRLIVGDEQSLEQGRYIKILAGCRSNRTFSSNAASNGRSLELPDVNSEDMRATLAAALAQMPDWSSQEREQAMEQVMKMAGPRFDYITSIAIPFLQQPFQRPLSNRLKLLPEGISDSYRRALHSMQENYIALLRTALIWTLYSGQPVRVKEVVEAYSGIYDAEHGLGVYEAVFAGAAGYRATPLEQQQLQLAAGDIFLKFWNNRASEAIVTPTDLDQIRRFCNGTDDRAEESNVEQHICAKCRSEASTIHALHLTEKEVHLRLALQLVRNLNSPLYQRRFGLVVDDEEEETSDGEDEDEDEDEDGGSNQSDPEDGEGTSDGEAEDEDRGQNQSNPDEEGGNGERVVRNEQDVGNDEDDAANSAHQDDLNDDAQAEGHTEGAERDDSDDSEEDDEEEAAIKLPKAEETEPTNDAYDGSNEYRYEIEMWHHHVREADRLWTSDEKTSSPEWAQLIEALDEFALDGGSAFRGWQVIWGSVNDSFLITGEATALHVAAYFGLTYWAKHLVNDLGFDPTALSQSRNALQYAAIKVYSWDMLDSFLSTPSDIATTTGSEANNLSALHMWLMDDPGVEAMNILRARDVDFNVPSTETKSTALHFFAEVGTDPAALEVILSSNTNGRPDINATNAAGNTPLHRLLWRRDPPKDLLRAFLSHGANANVDNNYSVRPLVSACYEPDVLKILLEDGKVEDIDDIDDDGDTALHVAAAAAQSESVRLLISHNANIESENKRGRRPLHEAAWHGDKETVEAFIEAGANLHSPANHNRTPFWFACYGQSEDKAIVLFNALKTHYTSTQINMPSTRLRTPLRLAATHGFSNVVQQLIDLIKASGNDLQNTLDMRDTKLGSTALHRAAWRGELDCLKILRNSGADATIKDNDDQTPLQLANDQWQRFGITVFEDIILLLTDLDKDTVKTDRELPATAAANDSVRVLEKLYGGGADMSSPDSYGWTPISLARRLGKTAAEQYLKHQTAWGGTLPSRWIHHKGSLNIEGLDLSEDGLQISQISGTRMCLSTDRPLPSGLDTFYFEIELQSIVDKDGDEGPDQPELAIGFCTLGAASYKFPGWLPKKNAPSGKSWAHHGDDGGFFANANSSITNGEPFGPGSTIGCGVDLERGTIFFVRDRERLEHEHTAVTGRLFPIIGLNENVAISTNFGSKPFDWDGANEKGSEDVDGKSADGTDTEGGAEQNESLENGGSTSQQSDDE